eukprot:223015-Alexandrium_andersonii.AAC.1
MRGADLSSGARDMLPRQLEESSSKSLRALVGRAILQPAPIRLGQVLPQRTPSSCIEQPAGSP